MARVALGLLAMLSFSAATWPGGGGRPAPRTGPIAQPRAAQAVAALQIVLPQPKLPLGQTLTFSVVAKNAMGQTIAGAYDHPIVLGAGYLGLSPSSIANSTQAGAVTATWVRGFTGGSRDTIIAYDDGVFTSAALAPATGFVYYDAGTNLNYDDAGFEMARASNGAVYYGEEGAVDGAVGLFTPALGTYSQVELGTGPVGILPSSDGAVWMAGGGSSHTLFRLPPGQFRAAALQKIAVPAPVSNVNYNLRQVVQDTLGGIWFDDNGGGRVFRAPLAGPYAASSLKTYVLPNGPPGTPASRGRGQGMVLGNDNLLYVLDWFNGVVDQISPASGATLKQLILPQQMIFGANDTAYPRFIAKDGLGRLYLSYIADTTYSTPIAPGIDEFVPPSTTLKNVPIFEPPSGTQPDSIGIDGTNLYYADLYGALGYINTATNANRLVPTLSVAELSNADYFETPNGVAVMPDGTAWFSCQNSGAYLTPACLGHTAYLGGWSLFPGPNVTVLLGTPNAQGVGIMEAPTAQSGPFKVASSNPAICTIGGFKDHNFYVTGVRTGTCVVTVTDAAATSAALHITVQAAANMRDRHRKIL